MLLSFQRRPVFSYNGERFNIRAKKSIRTSFFSGIRIPILEKEIAMKYIFLIISAIFMVDYLATSQNYDLTHEASSTPESTIGGSPEAFPNIGVSAPRKYPCKANFNLLKFYSPEFVLYYVCEHRTREQAKVIRATCPDGFFQDGSFCIRNGEWCPRPSHESKCSTRVCGTTGEFRIIGHRDYCLYCPPGFYLDEYVMEASCYGVFKEEPQCPPSQFFDLQSGECKKD